MQQLTIITEENLLEIADRLDVVAAMKGALSTTFMRYEAVAQFLSWLQKPSNGFVRSERWWNSPATQQKLGSLKGDDYFEFLRENGNMNTERLPGFLEDVWAVLANRRYALPDERGFEHEWQARRLADVQAWLAKHPTELGDRS